MLLHKQAQLRPSALSLYVPVLLQLTHFAFVEYEVLAPPKAAVGKLLQVFLDSAL